jgi:hypothetical protein
MIIQRTIDTYVGYWNYNTNGGAVGSYDLVVPIPIFSALCEFGVITKQALAGGTGATISFDLIDSNVQPNTTSVGALFAATAYTSFVSPFETQWGIVPSKTVPQAQLPYSSSVGFSIGTAALTAGALIFFVRCVTFDF